MTRNQLIEFLVETAKEKAHLEYIADALIKEGFCKVDEPREYWLFFYKCNNSFANLMLIKPSKEYPESDVYMVHVREVVEE
ncbi:MAG: hypothetical protein KA968_08105 [Chitinophagaceae bacterium]|nr:hypothetical protein [Chitinophagaceae bacterium]